MGAGDHVDGDQLAYFLGGGSSGIGGGLHRAYIATDHDGDQTTAYDLLAHQLDVGGFDHGIGSFDRADQAFGLDHS